MKGVGSNSVKNLLFGCQLRYDRRSKVSLLCSVESIEEAVKFRVVMDMWKAEWVLWNVRVY